MAARRARSGDDGILIIARTDAAAVEGIENAIARARTYGEAGADVLFVEAPSSGDELAMIADELGDWPLVANMVECRGRRSSFTRSRFRSPQATVSSRPPRIPPDASRNSAHISDSDRRRSAGMVGSVT